MQIELHLSVVLPLCAFIFKPLWTCFVMVKVAFFAEIYLSSTYEATKNDA